MRRSSKARSGRQRGLGWVLIAAAAAVIAITGFMAQSLRSFRAEEARQPPVVGVSFSIEYAQELDLNWRQAYLALLNGLGVKHLRLMSYWEEIEPSPDHYDFTALDYEMSQARSHGADVTLAIGERQPRYPECHLPAWATSLSPSQRKTRLEAFITAVVKHYRGDSTITSYQLENEALNDVYAKCPDSGRTEVVSEFNLVKSLDPNRPIIMNASDEFGLPLGQPRGDQFGLSVYHRVYLSAIHRYFTYPQPPAFEALRAALIWRLTGRPVIIHELQAEPWGPVATERLTIAQQNQTMDAARLKAEVAYAQATGIKTYYLWGGEWWYWRLTKYHDPSLWDTAQTIFRS